MSLQNLLQLQFASNTGRDYLMALAIFVAALIVLKIFKLIILARLRKLSQRTKNDIDDLAIKIISDIKLGLYIILSFYISARWLVLPDLAMKTAKVLLIIILIYEIIKVIQNVIEYTANKTTSKDEKGYKVSESTLKTINIVIKIVLWSFGLVLLLSNLGVNVTSLIAGLGIGGIAIAFALQNILSDIFASFSIVIDKPFQIGDFIKIGNDMGKVEKIGIKTTRLRTPDGEQLIISNTELTSARVQNFKRLEKRRALFKLGVIYETAQDKLEKIPSIIQEIIKNTNKTEFDRCHFKEFGDFSLNFEISFYVQTRDYVEYRDVVQEVNLAIFEAFKKERIEFAYPTSLEYQRKV